MDQRGGIIHEQHLVRWRGGEGLDSVAAAAVLGNFRDDNTWYTYLGEFVCMLPLSLPCLRGKVSPKRLPVKRPLPASIFNPLGVSRDSMRAPMRRSSLDRFLAEFGLPFETVCIFSIFARRLERECENREVAQSNYYISIFWPFQKSTYFSRGVAKIGPVRFSRVL